MSKKILFLCCFIVLLIPTQGLATHITLPSDYWPVQNIFSVITRQDKHYIIYKGKGDEAYAAITDFNLNLLETKDLCSKALTAGYVAKYDTIYVLWYDWDEENNVTYLNLSLLKDGKRTTKRIMQDDGGQVTGSAVNSDSHIAIYWVSRISDDPYLATYDLAADKLVVKAFNPTITRGSDVYLPFQREVLALDDSFVFFVPDPASNLPLIFPFTEEGELQAEHHLTDFVADGNQINNLGGAKARSADLLLWGTYKDKDWWFSFFDVTEKKVVKSAVVNAPLNVVNTIFAAGEAADGSLYFCMRAFVFKLDSNFSLVGYWKPEGQEYYSLETMQIREDGKLLVSGSINGFHGEPTVWLIAPEEFLPMEPSGELHPQ